MFLAVDGEAAGIIAVADTLKENSKKAVEAFHRMGLEVVMLTGDNQRTAKAIANQIGVDRVLAEVLPEMKAEEVRRLQSEGKKVGMVGMGSMMRLPWHRPMWELRLEPEPMWRWSPQISH